MTNYDILKEYEAHQTPVPSYKEWEQLQQWADFTDDYHELREKLEIAEYENAELKELLKEIRDSITESQLKLTPEGFKLITKIVAKIDEALR